MMKKIFTLSAVLFTAIIFSSCTKQNVYEIDERYWLSKERGEIVYASYSCSYYIIETPNGYAIVSSLSAKPYVGDVLYGDFSYYGVKDIYDRSGGLIISGDVKEYWLTYSGAQDAINYYCY
jgi:hypothetical protein